MYKKLSDDKLNALINAGISEFAKFGFDGASLSRISKNAGISVGVIYKYYEDKDALFLACVHSSLNDLSEVLKNIAAAGADDLHTSVKKLVNVLIQHAKTHGDINRMYNEVTSVGAGKYTVALAKEIEAISAAVYTELIEKAKRAGKIKETVDAPLFAFFFDDLLMMVQFSYCCDYYKERLKIYCGNDIFENDERLSTGLTEFIMGALGVK